MMEKFIGKKNGQIKELISNMWLIFNTIYNLSYQMLVQNFKVLCQVVPEKSLTKISIFITFGVRDSKSGK